MFVSHCRKVARMGYEQIGEAEIIFRKFTNGSNTSALECVAERSVSYGQEIDRCLELLLRTVVSISG